ncbi:heme exporter protein CcmB [Taibaiella sp. KBW10]|uniref:heme exporter protein CcmB n=1 Tax=Taibaiella sp. KBW10 TaxID=2153357 RepID=UPI001F355037|nr:heme exporter protein CcmB [Taibaiella sp. KBW10]
MNTVLALIKKDILLEWRQKHTFFSVLLYVSCTVFVIYMMAAQPETKVWNALFWIAELFVTVNTVAKSFLQENTARNRYYFTIVPPVKYLLAKMIYSIILMLVISLLSLGLFNILLGYKLLRPGMFIAVVCLGASCLSVLFTFLSAIAAQAKQNAALMAIMGFPIAIVMLMMLSKLANAALSNVLQEGWGTLIAVMAGMNFLILGIGVILFPFLWKE